MRISSILLLQVLALSACSEGGDDERPLSEVRLARDHHLFGMIGRPSFTEYPVQQNEVGTLSSVMRMSEGSVYGIDGALAEQQYFLAKTGHLSLALAQPRAPTLIFHGGYGLAGTTGHMFFTDRVGSLVGLYIGLPFIGGTPDIAAIATSSPRWHMLSMHVLFAGNEPKSPDNVGQAFAGMFDLATDGSITGKGFESKSHTAEQPITGSIAGFDGGYTLNLSYGTTAREFEAGGEHKVIFGVDGDRTDGAAGMMAMLRRLDAEPSRASLEGKYILGLWTIFLDPDNSGMDSAIGSLEITDTGFRLNATNAKGIDFSYSGQDVTASSDPSEFGRLSFTVSKTNEVWLGAITEDRNTIVIVDHNPASPSSGQSELNFIVAVREDNN